MKPIDEIGSIVWMEIMMAYIDVHIGRGNPEFLMAARKLDLKSRFTVRTRQAIDIMKDAVPNGYNAFRADILGNLGPSSDIYLCREGSVCIYVVGRVNEDKKSLLLCDEFSYDENTNETRIWWD